MSAAEQTQLFTATLPDVFVDAFRELERAAGVPHATLTCGEHLIDALGHHWIELRHNNERFGLMGRSDLVAAARDLFNQVHGFPRIAATTGTAR